MSYLGTNKIGKMYLGSTAIGKAYLGNDLVFQQGGGIQPVMIPYIRGGADGSYIDTGITPDSTTRVIVWARNFNPYGGIIFGSRVAYQNQAFALSANGYSQSGLITIQYGNVAIDASSGDHFRYLGGYHKYEMQQISISVDDTQLFTGSGTFSGNSLNLHIFGINNGGTHTSTFSPMDICACQIYKNNVLVRDYTAVNTPSVGLYDAVSQTLFTNAGSGSFTYGEFNKNAYTPLEYIECDGNQYFDSGIVGGYSVPMVVNCMPTGTTARYYVPIGGRTYPSARCEFFFGSTSSANVDITVGYYNTSKQIYDGSALTGNKIVLFKNNNVFSAYKNSALIGSSYTGNASTSFSTGRNIYVGTINNGGTPYMAQSFIGRLYAVSLGRYRNYVPAKVNNIVGMYDTYNDQFYHSESETPFIAGLAI